MPQPMFLEEMQAILDQANALQTQLTMIPLPCVDTHAERALRVDLSLVRHHIAHVVDHLRIIQAIRLPDVLAATEETPIIERGTTKDERTPPSA
jgi:hypothetical protein